MRRWVVVMVFAVCSFDGTGCAQTRTAARWRLLQPPEVSDQQAPRGVRILPKAPLEEWREVAVLGSEEECLAAKERDVDRAANRARAELGDDEAKFALPLRRAVNTRCVRGE